MRAITIKCQHGLLFVVSTVIVLFAINQTSQAQQILGNWGPIGPPHPQAAAQPATIGGQPTVAQYLWSLKAWNERLYAGYGDADLNGVSVMQTQFAVTPFDPKTALFASPPVFQFNTEAVPLYRDLAGRLFAPNLDPAYETISNKNFAVGTKSGVWTEHVEQPITHIFDVATLNLTDVWMVGMDCKDASTGPCNDAVAWRSTDGGNTFQEKLRVHPPAGFSFARFCFAGVLNNRLYVQDRNDTTSSGQHRSWVFDGSNWSEGPDLFPRRDLDPGNRGYQPMYFKGRMVYMTRFPFEGDDPYRKQLVAFNGTSASYVDIPPAIRNFTVDGSYIYVLAANGEVRRTSDSSFLLPWAQWESFSDFTVQDTLRPTRNAGNSIAVLNGKLYIGTSQAQLYRYSTTLDVIDDQRFFVEQQYRDFLEREADQGGLDFWTGVITGCGSDTTCIGNQRVAVSKAFWYSDEFLQKHSALVNPPGVSPKFNNHEFVRLCYLIYLQRDPNLTQEDRDGWAFWENEVNHDTANNPDGYDHVIKAFVECPDYRTRFGG